MESPTEGLTPRSVYSSNNENFGDHRTEILRGKEKTRKLLLSVLSKAGKIKIFTDAAAPALLVREEDLHKLLFNAKLRGVKTKCITEITRENSFFCRQLANELGVEVRHLDNSKGNFSLTEKEYLATSKIIGGAETEAIYSNTPELVAQNTSLFETLWTAAIPGDAKLAELEGKPIQLRSTRIIRDSLQILAETKQLVKASHQYSVCSVPGGLLYAYNYALDQFKEILSEHALGKHGGIRWLTFLDENCVEAAKIFLALGMEIRHLTSVPLESFGFSESEVGITLARLEGGRLNNIALFSSEPLYLDHYASIFEALWANGQDANDRIRQVEQRIAEPEMKLIYEPVNISTTYLQLLSQAKEEILLLLPSTNTFRRIASIGVIEALRSASSHRGVKVSLLSPLPNNEEVPGGIDHRSIREATSNTVTVLVVDRIASLNVEIYDDSKTDFGEAVGVATYSTRNSTVKANVRFFERMWEEVAERKREEQLLEKERRSRREAELLQDILAHDVRNYNQIVRISAELLKDGTLRDQNDLLLEEILTAIDRSTDLVERAKKLGKIISQSNVRLYPIDLDTSLRRSLNVVVLAHPEKGINPRIESVPGAKVLADDFLDELFTNVLSNAVNYTETQSVPLEIRVEATSSEEDGRTRKFWKISIVDHGRGIPEKSKEKVFVRYLESAHGSGLGLSIVYALVVERYFGKVKIKDRVKGNYKEGTVVELWLPAVDENQ